MPVRPPTRLDLWMTAILTVLVGLILATSCSAQTVGGSLGGAVHRGAHLWVDFAATARAGVGPVRAEFVHEALEDGSQIVDLFSYRLTLQVQVTDIAGVRPFVLAGAGLDHWREWTCADGSCAAGADGDAPGRFTRRNGQVLTVGVGARRGWLRADVRYDRHWSGVRDDGVLLLLGFAIL